MKIKLYKPGDLVVCCYYMNKLHNFPMIIGTVIESYDNLYKVLINNGNIIIYKDTELINVSDYKCQVKDLKLET